MRICLVGDFSGNHDEGMKNIANKLHESLKKNNSIYAFDLNRIYTISIWASLRKFEPGIIFYIPGPSFFSFVFLTIMRVFTKNPKTVMFATHPKIRSGKHFIRLFRPDLLLTQSKKSEHFFAELKFKTKFFPNGVDTEKFYPVTKEQKIKLREKWGINNNRFIILHIGHIKSNRNIGLLSRLNSKDDQVIIVGSTLTQAEKELESKLRKLGCIVFNKYIEHIEEIYQLADAYIFPTVDQESSIEIPLSVLEAMSCNLPVITTKFRGLPDIFGSENGLFFVSSGDEIKNKIKIIRENTSKVQTREMVSKFSWDQIYRELDDYLTKRWRLSDE